MKTETTEKRLFQYALTFKKGILIGIICLMIATGMELAGPLIAKKIIDDHIVGIEGVWHQIAEKKDEKTIYYQDKYYKRSDRESANDHIIGKATLIQIDKNYYFVNREVPLTGKRSVNGDQVTIQTPEGPIKASGQKLSLTDLAQFIKPEKRPIMLLLGLYVLLLVVAGLFQFFQTYMLQKSSNQIVKKMRNDVFSHIQRLPIQYFVKRPAGTIVARVTNDTEAIRDLYERVLSIVITSFIYMFGVYIAMFFLDAKLAALCLLAIPLIYIWMRLYKIYGSKFNQVIRSTNSKINGNINEFIQGMPIIQAFSREKQTKKEFEILNTRHFTYQRKLLKLNALTSHNLVTFFRNMTFVVFIWHFGSFSLEPGSVVSIGLLYAFVDYLTRLFGPINNIVNQLPLLEQARVAGGRVFQLMDEEIEDVNHIRIPRYQGNISFENVSFAYDDEYVLHDISFNIKSGETAAFVGHTGSGKSSLMNLLFRFYDPQKGKIFIDNHNIKEWSRQQVRSHMGIVLQDPFLFSGTVLSNVTMNDERISREQAIAALKAVGADRFIEKLPKGYDAEVTEGGTTFSLGERQLISFARALAFDPAILVLDEATANIDTESETLIQEALKVLKKGRTTLVIAHRLSTIRDADTIFVLEHGKIKESGNHHELLEQKGIYSEMYRMQQQGARMSLT